MKCQIKDCNEKATIKFDRAVFCSSHGLEEYQKGNKEPRYVGEPRNRNER